MARLLQARAFQRLLSRTLMMHGRLSRAMTLGVRAALIKNDHVILVRHSYTPGWHLPGGGVEAGESVHEALNREVGEEAGAILSGTPQLFGVYRNASGRGRDHVTLFVCRNWHQPAPPRLPNMEIVDCRLFAVDDLPPDTTRATRARLAEILSGKPVAPDW
jgi:8-oxo-dGTP pyrophosphatase MutT (NUDIX family)